MQDPCCRYGDSRQVTLLANAIAIALTEGLSSQEKNILGNLLTLVSGSILSMAAIEEACKKD
jgi:hypothetical protein